MAGSTSFWRRRKHPKTSAQHYQERRERRRRQMGYGLLPITIESIADVENLYEVYQKVRQGGPAPGIDRVTYLDLSNSEVGDIVRMLSKTLLDGSYRPHRTRPVDIPKPGTDEWRRLNLGVICDRVVAAALHRRLNWLWETVFLPCSYGFRESRNPWQMLAEMEVQMVEQDRWVLAVDDLKSAFCSVPIDEVLASHEKLLATLKTPEDKEERAEALRQQERLMWLIETVVRGSEPTRTRGIDQGNPYSPTCLNAVLHYLLDLPVMDIMDSPLRWYRYADNICYLARSVPEGRLFLRQVRRLLAPLGIIPKGDGGVQDLNRGKEVQLLGFTLQRQQDQVIYGLGKKALDHLTQNLSDAHATIHPQETARLSLFGWVESVGPAFENGVTEISTTLRLAADNGFRELASPRELRQHWEIAWRRWQDTRQRAYRQQQG